MLINCKLQSKSSLTQALALITYERPVVFCWAVCMFTTDPPVTAPSHSCRGYKWDSSDFAKPLSVSCRKHPTCYNPSNNASYQRYHGDFHNDNCLPILGIGAQRACMHTEFARVLPLIADGQHSTHNRRITHRGVGRQQDCGILADPTISHVRHVCCTVAVKVGIPVNRNRRHCRHGGCVAVIRRYETPHHHDDSHNGHT